MASSRKFEEFTDLYAVSGHALGVLSLHLGPQRNAMAGNGFHRRVGWGVVADRETSAAADGPCVAMYNYCRKLFPFFATPSHPYG